jgi:hypothetical protein
MSFPVKITLGVAALIAVAVGAVFLFSSSEEKAIQQVLEGALKAAEEGNEDAVIAVVSPNYRNGEQKREHIIARIRAVVPHRVRPATMKGAAIQVSGDDADASVRVEVGALQYRRSFGLKLSLKKESGVWKVTSAEETGN